MPSVSGFDLLPPEIRAWFDATLRARGFGDYEALTEELGRRLTAAGWAAPPALSTVGRWGKARKAAMQSTLRVAELLSALHDAAPDQGAKRTAGLATLVQDKIVGMLFRIAEIEEANESEPADAGLQLELGKLYAKLGTSVAQMQRAEIQQRKWAAEVERAALTEAAGRAATAAQSAGVSPGGIAALRAAIMGAL